METLSKEKSELDDKIRSQTEGSYVRPAPPVRLMSLRSLHGASHSTSSPHTSAEYEAQKEETTNAIKANYEKVLNTERTLKTQVPLTQIGYTPYWTT